MTPDPGSRDPRSPLAQPHGPTGRLRDLVRDLPRSIRLGFAGAGTLALSLVLAAAIGQRSDGSAGAPAFELPPGGIVLGDAHLPMEVNARVEYWIGRYLTVEREGFEQLLVREGLYGGMVREKLRARGMPEQLLYLAMIESGFSTGATSPVAAAGMWQFLGATARSYGLSVDGWVDERRDPVRATDAALDYLQELHESFGSWYLAAAAYNAGPQRVAQALRRAGALEGGEEALYWRIREDLPRETREYVPKILAAALLAEQADHFGIEIEQDLPYLFDQVLVPGGTSLAGVAEAIDRPVSLLRELNPHLIRGATPPGRSFPVRVPLGESHRVVAALPSR